MFLFQSTDGQRPTWHPETPDRESRQNIDRTSRQKIQKIETPNQKIRSYGWRFSFWKDPVLPVPGCRPCALAPAGANPGPGWVFLYIYIYSCVYVYMCIGVFIIYIYIYIHVCLESPSDPYKMGSVPKMMGSLTHFLRVMETSGGSGSTLFKNQLETWLVTSPKMGTLKKRPHPNGCVTVCANFQIVPFVCSPWLRRKSEGQDTPPILGLFYLETNANGRVLCFFAGGGEPTFVVGIKRGPNSKPTGGPL